MRTDIAPGSSRPVAFQFPTESQQWAQRHVAPIERRSFTYIPSYFGFLQRYGYTHP